jgi:hypothetical protein
VGEKADNGGSSPEHVYYAKSPTSAIIIVKLTTRIKVALVIVPVDVGMQMRDVVREGGSAEIRSK